MTFPQPPSVSINLPRVRENAVEVWRRCGVPVIAVIKADAYGLGAARVVEALKDERSVAGLYCFSLREAIEANTRDSGKPTICLVGHDGERPQDYLDHNVRPAVWDIQRATKLRNARPILAVDTGMQRFACPPEQIDDVRRAGWCDEAFTHATTIEQVHRFVEVCRGRGMRLHAAATSLLHAPEARLDRVRPGLALYRDAVRVTTRLIEVRDSRGPTGYGGFIASTGRHGVIPVGYANRLRPGPCIINGARRAIVECGMQTSFVEVGRDDREGHEVTLLGDGLTVEDVARAWSTSPQQTLSCLATCGVREYL